MEFFNNKQGQMGGQLGGGGYTMQPYAAIGMGAMGPQFGVTPEMMQGYNAEMMQNMSMAMPMMMGVPGQAPMMMMGPAMGPAMAMNPQLTQVLADAAKGGRSSNVFFKTRICHKWRNGTCPYGDKCTYAHGEHELRYVPPELVAQLEREQAMQEGGGQGRQGGGGGGDADSSKQYLDGGGQGGPGGPRNFFKTRLCIKFMQTGMCHKGSACTFAHGYEDLRQPAPPQGMMPMQGGGGNGFRGGIPQHPYQQQQRLHPAQHALMMQSSSGSGTSSGGSGGGPAPGPGGDPSDLDRARAMSAIAGVGDAAGGTGFGAMQAAMAAAQSGAAFRETPYGDSIAEYIKPEGGGSD